MSMGRYKDDDKWIQPTTSRSPLPDPRDSIMTRKETELREALEQLSNKWNAEWPKEVSGFDDVAYLFAGWLAPIVLQAIEAGAREACEQAGHGYAWCRHYVLDGAVAEATRVLYEAGERKGGS